MLGQNLVPPEVQRLHHLRGHRRPRRHPDVRPLGSVSAESFTIFGSLSLLMLTVVGGIGYVSGALFGGLLPGAGVAAVVATFNNLAAGSDEPRQLYASLATSSSSCTALIGMSVGQNPSGAVHDFVTDLAARWPRPGRCSIGAGGASESVALRPAGRRRDQQLVVRRILTVRCTPARPVRQILMPEAMAEDEPGGERRRRPDPARARGHRPALHRRSGAPRPGARPARTGRPVGPRPGPWPRGAATATGTLLETGTSPSASAATPPLDEVCSTWRRAASPG